MASNLRKLAISVALGTVVLLAFVFLALSYYEMGVTDEVTDSILVDAPRKFFEGS